MLHKCQSQIPEIIFSKEELIERYNFLYGIYFPKPEKIFDDTEQSIYCKHLVNTIEIHYNDSWVALFTFNSPRDYKLVF